MVASNEAKMDGSSLSAQIEDFGIRSIQRKIDSLKMEIEKGIYRVQEEGNNQVSVFKHYKDICSVDLTWMEQYTNHVIESQQKLRDLKRSMEDLDISGKFKW